LSASDEPFQLALRHAQAGRLADAIELLRQITELQPTNVSALNNLGVCYRQFGHSDAAIEQFRRALAVAPDRPHVWNNLGNALRGQGRLDDASSAYEHALAIEPENAEALCNLGTCLKDAGRIDDAITYYRRSLQVAPSMSVHSNLLYAMYFQEGNNPVELLREHRAWAERYAAPLRAHWPPHPSDHKNDRRLRIGYVSPDLRLHPVGRFMLPLLKHHDRERVEVYCYSTSRVVDDEYARRLQSHAEVWRSAGSLGDDELVSQIRADRIDILVDLSLHMAGNRLRAFARRPAPVQVTYLGYCGTTGLDVVDFRLTDPYLDPADGDERYAEKSIRLPSTYWIYEPAIDDLQLTPPPVVTTGHVMFGCLNNFTKVSDGALAAWAQILRAVPQSRLLLHAHEGSHRHRVREAMIRSNVDPQRVEFTAFVPLDQFYALHNRIDIALDPFPYAGGTTTCDGLWMGVPVVTLGGHAAVGRGGVSILSNVGLPELIAMTTDQYVRIAAGLAAELPRLRELRLTVRSMMRRSPLMDAHAFALQMEDAYRRMWAVATQA
jgi:predicted O-linked N-acetylglucosamine transferase (SPINDLY family)